MFVRMFLTGQEEKEEERSSPWQIGFLPAVSAGGRKLDFCPAGESLESMELGKVEATRGQLSGRGLAAACCGGGRSICWPGRLIGFCPKAP